MKDFGLKVLDVVATATDYISYGFAVVTDKIDGILVDKGYYDEAEDGVDND